VEGCSVTNHDQEKDQEPRSEREREALLERMFRDYGLSQGPERAGEIERDKARFEHCKTLLLLNVALLASLGAVTVILPQPQDLWLLQMTLFVGLLGLVLTNFVTWICAMSIGLPLLERVAMFGWFAVVCWFLVEVMIFVVFLIHNFYA
jgi:hypothetical protein